MKLAINESLHPQGYLSYSGRTAAVLTRKTTMKIQQPTKTDATKRAYIKRAKTIIRRYKNSSDQTKQRNIAHFYNWLIAQKPNWTRNTWRQYKASMLYACKVQNFAQLEKMLMNTRNDGCKDNKHRIPTKERLTSGKKKKSISEKELSRIADMIKERPPTSYWERAGLKLFISSYHIGLRPCEFFSATVRTKPIDDCNSQEYIVVKNAKTTNGRSHGKLRHISIGQMDENIRKLIINTINMARASRDAHNRTISPEDFVKRASQGFSIFMRKVFPRKILRITLYSARHQFCANMKRSGLSRAHIAALMGHGSDVTAGRHYGKRRSGRSSPFAPTPVEAEVAKVRIKAKPFKNKVTTMNKQPSVEKAKDTYNTSIKHS